LIRTDTKLYGNESAKKSMIILVDHYWFYIRHVLCFFLYYLMLDRCCS